MLSCSTVHVASLFLFNCFIEQINDDDDDDEVVHSVGFVFIIVRSGAMVLYDGLCLVVDPFPVYPPDKKPAKKMRRAFDRIRHKESEYAVGCG